MEFAIRSKCASTPAVWNVAAIGFEKIYAAELFLFAFRRDVLIRLFSTQSRGSNGVRNARVCGTSERAKTQTLRVERPAEPADTGHACYDSHRRAEASDKRRSHRAFVVLRTAPSFTRLRFSLSAGQIRCGRSNHMPAENGEKVANKRMF